MILFSRLLLSFNFDWEDKLYQTLETVFHHISKHLKLRQKYSAARRIFNSLLSVWKCNETLSLVFDILRQKLVSVVLVLCNLLCTLFYKEYYWNILNILHSYNYVIHIYIQGGGSWTNTMAGATLSRQNKLAIWRAEPILSESFPCTFKNRGSNNVVWQ